MRRQLRILRSSIISMIPETGERRFQIPHIRLREAMDYFAGCFLGPHARWQKGSSDFGLISFDSSQGDFAQEENCPVGGGLRCLRTG